jgi:amidase
VRGGLADGISGLRIGVLEEGFEEAEVEVNDLVMAALDVLAQAGAHISRVSVPEHQQVRAAQNALNGEGGLAVFNTGFYGAFTRTYYPASLLAAINQLWFSHADVLSPRTKLSRIAASMSRRKYDTALMGVDVLVMPTCLMTAPKNQRPDSYMQALEEDLSMRNMRVAKNTQPFNYTGHPALALPVGKSSAGLPASMPLVGRFFEVARPSSEEQPGVWRS